MAASTACGLMSSVSLLFVVAGLATKPFYVLGFADLWAKVLSLAELEWLKNKIDRIIPPSAVGSGEIPLDLQVGSLHFIWKPRLNLGPAPASGPFSVLDYSLGWAQASAPNLSRGDDAHVCCSALLPVQRSCMLLVWPFQYWLFGLGLVILHSSFGCMENNKELSGSKYQVDSNVIPLVFHETEDNYLEQLHHPNLV